MSNHLVYEAQTLNKESLLNCKTLDKIYSAKLFASQVKRNGYEAQTMNEESLLNCKTLDKTYSAK